MNKAQVKTMAYVVPDFDSAAKRILPMNGIMDNTKTCKVLFGVGQKEIAQLCSEVLTLLTLHRIILKVLLTMDTTEIL